MDPLSPLLARFSLSARVFYSGNLCSNVTFHERPGLSYLHVLRAGTLSVTHSGSDPLEVKQPSLFFYPQPYRHGFAVKNPVGAELVCAAIDVGAGLGNPLLRGLPPWMIIALADIPGIDATVALLFDEAFASRPGRAAAIDRLAEYFVVLLLRHALAARIIHSGVIAALADPRLAKALHCLHEQPEREWSLDALAQRADMSRARFAAQFREVSGLTPMEYLTDVRIGIAQTLLKRGKPSKVVAPMVGYSNPAAFSRAFMQRVGLSPTQWIADRDPMEPLAQSPYVSPATAKKRGNRSSS